MRAAVSTRYGPPEVVQVVDDAPEPEVGRRRPARAGARDDGQPHRLRLPRGRTRSSSAPISGLRRPKVDVWGTEYAGVVERVGREVTRFAPGDQVFGYAEGASARTPSSSPWPSPRSSRRCPTASTCPRRGRDRGRPLRAERHPARRDRAGRAGARPRRDRRDRVGGGAAARRPRRARHRHRAHRARRAGARARRPPGRRPRGARTSPRIDETVDVVLDMVGKSTFGACRRILDRDGVYVSCDLGPFAQNIALPLVTKVGPRPPGRLPVPDRDARRCSSTCARAWRAARSARCSTRRPSRSRTSSRPTATSRPARRSATSSSPST